MINKDIVKYYAILWIIRNVAVQSWEGQNSKKDNEIRLRIL